LKVAIFDFQHKPPHLETSFDLAHRHLAAGDAVAYRFLGFDLPKTAFMSPVPGSQWFGPWLPERKAARLLAHQRLSFSPRTRLPIRPLPFALPNTLDELRSIEYRGFDVGMAVASSLITKTGNSRMRPSDHRVAVRKTLQGAIAAYDFVHSTLEREKPDLVYIFNGRFAYERAVLRACQDLGVQYLIHERGSSPHHFYLRPYIPQDRVRLQEDLLTAWNAVMDRDEARSRARRWFEERRQGQPRDWPSFTEKQVRSRLPNIPMGKRLIAYFSSSDDEYEAIGNEYRWEGWTDQLHAFRALVDAVGGLGDAHLVLRVHPHLTTKHASERDRWLRVAGNSPWVTVIPPESEADTYALVDAASVVVSAGSTVGIEAVYWSRPSILLGPSEYDALGAVHRANDRTALHELLASATIPVDPEAAMAYGYHRATYGEPFTQYDPSAFSHGTFMGVELRPQWWRWAAESRNRVLSRFKWLGPRRGR
jgi:hypothetical protein